MSWQCFLQVSRDRAACHVTGDCGAGDVCNEGTQLGERVTNNTLIGSNRQLMESRVSISVMLLPSTITRPLQLSPTSIIPSFVRLPVL